MAAHQNRIERTFTVTPTVAELAECFACLASDEMAEFFDRVAQRVKQDDYNAPMQWEYVRQDEGFTAAARDLLCVWGQYASDDAPMLVEGDGR